jgi:hypothetical protein
MKEPTMGLLEELAVRCEAATRRDTEAETMIYAEINGWPTEWRGNALVRLTDYYPIGTIDPGERNRWFTGHIGAPAYTGSIDAAIALVPDGCTWSVGDWSAIGKGVGATCWPSKDCCPVGFDGISRAATPALALTAASLRAHHALALSKGSDT